MERKKKKIPVLGIQEVELHRGPLGYGFTISGQFPCMLSCVVAGSPASRVGLRPGDFVLSVNGISVIQMKHDEVVKMIGNASGRLLLQVSRDYMTTSDATTSEEESTVEGRSRRTNAGSRKPGTTRHRSLDRLSMPISAEGPVLRCVVGYLGSMPISRENAPGTPRVRGCIGKLRVEKKLHTLVLLTLHRSGVFLQNPHGMVLASHSSAEISGCAGYSEDGRFFGIVTKTTPEDENEIVASCHVFMVDARMHAHTEHVRRARAFRFECSPSADGSCEEFPLSADPILNHLRRLFPDARKQKSASRRAPMAPYRPPSSTPTSSNNSDSGLPLSQHSHERWRGASYSGDDERKTSNVTPSMDRPGERGVGYLRVVCHCPGMVVRSCVSDFPDEVVVADRVNTTLPNSSSALQRQIITRLEVVQLGN
ncbi:unnamed protein product [Cyprideis torosa]|uniref:Uncharacterized protein n=1 Tax=Cyprideis torosa TaxID=163714 RepID=A0A7R8ZIP4_9CRUS|nr:unnamed protein product [Cyprideis torosa]CAG0885166.1 unnamed protein product [Cyprideis torosa]